MRHPSIELKNLSIEENFAIAALYKQKECLKTWLNYLNVKNIHLPQEREKYRIRIAQINDAIKILEDEFQKEEAQSSENNLLNSSNNSTTPNNKNKKETKSKSNSLISKTKVNQFKNSIADFRPEFDSNDN